MLHPDTELRKVNDQIGYGVFATKPIPKGTITWALDPLDQILGTELDQCLARRYGDSLLHYTWVNAHGKRILCWDFGRFMNHSCDANSYGPGGCEFEIAVRDIAVGEELTSDYGTLNLDVPMSCACGASLCRGVVQSEDLEAIAPACDAHIREAFPHVGRVSQPLWQWVQEQAGVLEEMIHNPASIPSVLQHQWLPREHAIAHHSEMT